ncbi:hypothetical protein QYF36_016613 [Acer negundo]|nr:hypothetical protein QYF36_016613 [Acer negundo]
MDKMRLQDQYFPDGKFLTAGIGNSPSHVWKGILWRCSLLVQGLRWRIGPGSSIWVFPDPWLPRPSSFKPVAPITVASNLLVKDLLLPNGAGWDLHAVSHYFRDVDKEIIFSIPISRRFCEDVLIWHYDKHGIYTVKSGYHLAASLLTSEQCSSSATTWNLYSRKLPVSPLCPRCGVNLESQVHALFTCCHLEAIWVGLCWWHIIAAALHSDFRLILEKLKDYLSMDDFMLACMVVWSIWSERNLHMHEGHFKDPTAVIFLDKNLLSEFKCLQDSMMTSSRLRVIMIWFRLLPGGVPLLLIVLS